MESSVPNFIGESGFLKKEFCGLYTKISHAWNFLSFVWNFQKKKTSENNLIAEWTTWKLDDSFLLYVY